jgi:hypothetical protein
LLARCEEIRAKFATNPAQSPASCSSTDAPEWSGILRLTDELGAVEVVDRIAPPVELVDVAIGPGQPVHVAAAAAPLFVWER